MGLTVDLSHPVSDHTAFAEVLRTHICTRFCCTGHGSAVKRKAALRLLLCGWVSSAQCQVRQAHHVTKGHTACESLEEGRQNRWIQQKARRRPGAEGRSPGGLSLAKKCSGAAPGSVTAEWSVLWESHLNKKCFQVMSGPNRTDLMDNRKVNTGGSCVAKLGV